MNLEIRRYREKDLDAIFNFRSSYIQISYKDFVQRAKLNSELWFVVYDCEKLIGYCLGLKVNGNPNYIQLDEIVTNVHTDLKYKRKGIGTKLIKLFENQIWILGYKIIGLGCSDNYKVENFYLKNAYTPIEVVANDNGKELERVKIIDYETGKIIQTELRSKYNANEVNFIFEKYVNRS